MSTEPSTGTGHIREHIYPHNTRVIQWYHRCTIIILSIRMDSIGNPAGGSRVPNQLTIAVPDSHGHSHTVQMFALDPPKGRQYQDISRTPSQEWRRTGIPVQDCW